MAHGSRVEDLLPHGAEQRLRRGEILRRPASHDRQCSLLGRAYATHHRRLEVAEAKGSRPSRHRLAGPRVHRAHVNHQDTGPATSHRSLRPLQDRGEGRRVGHHGDDGVGIPGGLARRGEDRRSQGAQGLGLGRRPVVGTKGVSGLQDIPGHPPPHDTEANESDYLCHLLSLLFALRVVRSRNLLSGDLRPCPVPGVPRRTVHSLQPPGRVGRSPRFFIDTPWGSMLSIRQSNKIVFLLQPRLVASTNGLHFPGRRFPASKHSSFLTRIPPPTEHRRPGCLERLLLGTCSTGRNGPRCRRPSTRTFSSQA